MIFFISPVLSADNISFIVLITNYVNFLINPCVIKEIEAIVPIVLAAQYETVEMMNGFLQNVRSINTHRKIFWVIDIISGLWWYFLEGLWWNYYSAVRWFDVVISNILYAQSGSWSSKYYCPNVNIETEGVHWLTIRQ